MPHARIDASFFRKERNQAYRNWKVAIWRELIQNSVDAGCTRMDITITPTDGGFTLRFADNGPGMTRDVLNNVYFSVGATTKTDGNYVGGMGRARMLTCFSMEKWSIWSQDYVVTGSGGDYDEPTDHSFTNGCILEIAVDSYHHDSALSYLLSFLSSSNIRQIVTINGEIYRGEIANRGRHARNLVSNGQTFANVFVNKSVKAGRCIVRVNGVMMFSSPVSFEGQVIVELLPEMARSVLTSNRDGLRLDYEDVLTSFITELSVNTKTATRGARERKTTVVRRGGSLSVRSNQTRSKKTDHGDQEAAFVGSTLRDRITSTSVMPEIFEAMDDSSFETSYSRISYADRLMDNADQWIRNTFGDIYITDETNNPKVRKSIMQYIPEKWQISYKPSTGGLTVKGGTIIKLLLVWKVCVNYALEILCEHIQDYNHRYSLGFMFNDEDTLATSRRIDGVNILSLAPVDTDGKLKFSITDRSDLMILMGIAQHEVNHIVHSWHNEAFSTTREQIGFKFDQAECFRRIKTAIGEMPF